MNEDIRWKQRFEHFEKALSGLERACAQSSYNELERQGLIKGFEMCYELAWKTLQDYLREIGIEAIGPKPVLREAFKNGLIHDADDWASMHEGRNLASYVYDLERAYKLTQKIRSSWLAALVKIRATLSERS